MNGNKLIQALSTLNKEEWISYRKYLLMYTSETSDNYKVFAYLQKRKTKLNELGEMEDIKQKHFKSLSSKSILNILSKLYLWLEEWLVYYSIKKDKMESNLILVKQLNRRGIYNLADQKAKQLQKQIDNEKGLSVNKSRIQSDLYYYQYYSDNPVKSKKDILGKYARLLLESQTAQRLLVHGELINMEKRTGKYGTVIKDYNQHKDFIQNNKMNSILNSMNRLIESDSVEDFYNLKSLLLNNEFQKESDLEILVCMYLFKWSFIMVSQQKVQNENNAIEIVNFGLENNLLNPGGQLSAVRFLDLTNSITKISTIEETKIFIETWAKNVNSENEDAMRTIALATSFVVKRDYDNIPLQPTLLFYNDVNLKFHSISIYIVSCFNQIPRDHDLIYSLLNILYRTLSRYKQQIPQNYYLSYINFIKATKLILEHKIIDFNKHINIMHIAWIKSQIKKAQH